MSGTGRPEVRAVAAPGLSLGIVATRWHAEIVDTLVERARATAAASGITAPTMVRVAGAMEIPVVAQELARTHDAVVALGCVIRGATPHFDYVCQSVTHGLARLALDTGQPVANGILTCDTQDQAEERSGAPGSIEDKGAEAVAAALDTAVLLQYLRDGSAPGADDTAAEMGRERRASQQ
ncbi:6,7-dimethyl-8-ribityllumazine synthase [Lipingzhangella sp. LS1_29]|uniref:6,7-dimethyl-8-ribityllumazine synthase n=1 Tax=Lipingzhangella rawalii TaxID=2055835 RepID=A0ABU2H2C2_9ACTN|nr:6,7-dimethyl-8-ribityllumazine synthase [Lipingzhangella rawalii]MDS1269448.1 6,7-dimethyl-8-ribityllumazine synthase [Lipingzhangella rawalii]